MDSLAGPVVFSAVEEVRLMYTVVLMAALGGSVDLPDCGRHRRHGCCGGDCYGSCGGCYGGWGGCCGGGCYGGYGGCHGGWGGCCGGGYAYGGGARAWSGYAGSSGYAYSNNMTYPYGQTTVSGYYSPQNGALPTWSDVNRGAVRPASSGVYSDEPMPRSNDLNPNTITPQSGTNFAAPATVVVSLPPDARLMIGGNPTRSSSGERTFVTPPLEPGKTYFYSLKAELDRNGKKETASQNVEVRAGQKSRVTVEFPGEPAGK